MKSERNNAGWKERFAQALSIPFSLDGTLSKAQYWYGFRLWLIYVPLGLLGLAFAVFIPLGDVIPPDVVDFVSLAIAVTLGAIVHTQLLRKRLAYLAASQWWAALAMIPWAGIYLLASDAGYLPVVGDLGGWLLLLIGAVWFVYLGNVTELTKRGVGRLTAVVSVTVVAAIVLQFLWPHSADYFVDRAFNQDLAQQERILKRGIAKHPHDDAVRYWLERALGHEFKDKADRYIKAGDLLAAERTLKEGIYSHPDSALLKLGLIRLYIDSNQWEKLDTFARVNGIPMAPFDDSLDLIASHYFDARQWEQAARYYRQAAGETYMSDLMLPNSDSWRDTIRERRLSCHHLSSADLERLRNSAAAGFNGGGVQYVEYALADLLRYAMFAASGKDAECSKRAYDHQMVAEYVQEIWNWLPATNRASFVDRFKPDELAQAIRWLGLESPGQGADVSGR